MGEFRSISTIVDRRCVEGVKRFAVFSAYGELFELAAEGELPGRIHFRQGVTSTVITACDGFRIG